MTKDDMEIYSITIEAYDLKKHSKEDAAKWVVTLVTNKGEFIKYYQHKKYIRQLIELNLIWLEARNDTRA